MRNVVRCRRWLAACCVAATATASSAALAADLLIADRMTHGVYRYSESGEYLGTLFRDQGLLNQPAGLALSPDSTQLYVSSLQNNQVVKFDYNRFTGAATNPTIFADASDGLKNPNDILFSEDGSIIYISSLNGTPLTNPPEPLKHSGKVSRFHLDGSSAGPALIPPQPPVNPVNGYFQISSLAFHPTTGQLLVGAHLDLPSATTGGIAISDGSISTLPEFFTDPSPATNGATGLLVHDGYLYVSGLYAFSIRRVDLATGELDPDWEIPNVFFPQDLKVAPDGEGIYAGILGLQNGTGNISRYTFDGDFVEFIALPAGAGQSGFREATAFITVPEGLLGDFNGNGIVDTADYTVWRNAGPADTLLNDDTPGVVDASDYDDWRANFGSTLAASGGGAGAGVPEPHGLLLVAVGILASGLIRLRS